MKKKNLTVREMEYFDEIKKKFRSNSIDFNNFISEPCFSVPPCLHGL